MPKLNLSANIATPDAFYEQLLALHDGKTKEQSDAINARLILVLANHVGDAEILGQALAVAADPDNGEMQ